MEVVYGSGCGDYQIKRLSYLGVNKQEVEHLLGSIKSLVRDPYVEGVVSGRFVHTVLGSSGGQKKWRPVLKALGFKLVKRIPNAAHHNPVVTEDNQIEFWFLCTDVYSSAKKRKKKLPTAEKLLALV